MIYIYYIKKPQDSGWDSWSLITLKETNDKNIYEIIMYNKELVQNSIIYESKKYHHDKGTKYFTFDLVNNIATVIDSKLYKKFKQL